MEALVLDTNVVSYLMRGDPRGDLYRRHFDGKTLAVSFMTVGELYEGAYRRNWSTKKFSGLKDHLKRFVVIPFSPVVCETWGRIRAGRKHQPIAVDDGWIAATALAYGCPLVTHNPSDFVDITGLDLISEEAAEQE